MIRTAALLAAPSLLIGFGVALVAFAVAGIVAGPTQ
jgi:hypothetical protein